MYTLIRDIKPNYIIETGVLHGLTTVFILEVLRKNGSGQLLSVDLPSISVPIGKDGYSGHLPKGMSSGWIIPNTLRAHWRLEIRHSLQILMDKS